MKLSDFPYTVNKEMVEYSHWVPKTIALFNSNYSTSTGTISPVPCCGLPPEEDRLSSWDNSKNDITYGRYLLFKNTKQEIIKFWTGFNASKTGTEYGIWFEQKNIPLQYIKNLKNKSFPNATFVNGEVWIPMVGTNTDTDIDDQTVIDFWKSVLEVL